MFPSFQSFQMFQSFQPASVLTSFDNLRMSAEEDERGGKYKPFKALNYQLFRVTSLSSLCHPSNASSY